MKDGISICVSFKIRLVCLSPSSICRLYCQKWVEDVIIHHTQQPTNRMNGFESIQSCQLSWRTTDRHTERMTRFSWFGSEQRAPDKNKAGKWTSDNTSDITKSYLYQTPHTNFLYHNSCFQSFWVIQSEISATGARLSTCPFSIGLPTKSLLWNKPPLWKTCNPYLLCAFGCRLLQLQLQLQLQQAFTHR